MVSNNTNLKVRSLLNHISENGPISWTDCFSSMKDLLDKDYDTTISGKDSILITSDNIKIEIDENKISLSFDYDNENDADSHCLKEKYMSPEHLLEAELDDRSHLYSIGCILYECILGRPPFDDKKAKTVAENHIAFAPPGLATSMGKRKIPDRVEKLVHRCIEKNPTNRYQSIEQLTEALGQCLIDDISQKTEESSSREVINAKVDSKPLVVSGSIMLALTLIIVLTIQVTSSETFKAHIINSRTKDKNKYYLSIENGSYRAQMDFFGEGLTPRGDKVPLTIRQKKTNKILFATTQKKNLREAVEEALRRGLHLPAVDLRGADLRGVNLKHVDLIGADFSGANLKGANMTGARLINSIFVKANLENAILDSTKMSLADFRGAYLKGASFKNAYMPESNFSKASLLNANLENAIISSCKFLDTDFTNTNLKNADCENIVWTESNVTAKQFNQTLKGQKGVTMEEATKEALDRR